MKKQISKWLQRYRIVKSYNLFYEEMLQPHIAPYFLLQPNLTKHSDNKFILVIVDR